MPQGLRDKVGYPFKLAELLYAKYLTLFHDPPWKPLRVSGSLRGVQIVDDCEKPDKIIFHTKKTSGGRHERDATYFARCITLKGIDYTPASVFFTTGSKDYGSRASKNADFIASAFDRIIAGLAEQHYKILCSEDNLKNCYYCYSSSSKNSKNKNSNPKGKHIVGLINSGLLNIFRPSLYAPGRGSRLFRENGHSFVKEFIERIGTRICYVVSHNCDSVESLRRALHVLEAIYEPLWHEVSEGSAWGPADTRVATHSIFDHLYASAATMNITGADYSLGNGWKVVLLGFLVYAGWRGVGEWVKSGRKLSDVWAASWLATALIWKALGETIWCLGGDTLVVPGTRWNQFYLALLRNKLNEELFENSIGDVARSFYFWEGFPYYGYEPSHMILFLPLLEDADANCGDKGVIGSIVNAGSQLKNELKKDSCNVAGTLKEFLQQKAEEVRRAVEDAMKHAWEEAVKGIVDALPRVFNKAVANALEEALEIVKDVPPMDPLVVVVPIAVLYREKQGTNRLVILIGDKYVPVEGCTSREKLMDLIVTEFFEVFGIGGEDGARLAEALWRAYSALEKILGGAKNGVDKASTLAGLLSKLVYVLGFYELSRRVNESKQRIPRLGWARLAAEKHSTVIDAWRLVSLRMCGDRPRECGGVDWRNCSVCRRGIAVLVVPGRDEPGGDVSLEYKLFAQRICRKEDLERYGEECWRLWRPIFRPGEALCPYCLVKRLIGLSEVFASVSEKLLGYRPSREVRFPSTDDIAGLATKIALIDAAIVLAGLIGDDNTGKEATKVLEEILGVNEGSIAELLNIIRETIGDMSSELNEAIRDLAESVLTLGLRSSRGRALQEELRRAFESRESGEEIYNALREKLVSFINGYWWKPWLLWLYVRYAKGLARRLNGLSLKLLASAVLATSVELQSFLESPKANTALSRLSKTLWVVSREARKANKEKRSRDWSSFIEMLDSAREALEKPRLYYGILRFDVDRMGFLGLGIVSRIEEEEILGAEDYLEELVAGSRETGYYKIRNACYRLSSNSIEDEDRKKCSIQFLFEYLVERWHCLGDPLLEFLTVSGASLLITPSYHYAMANSMAYTLLRLGRVVERLGGMPVYLAGDEGLVVVPAWLPKGLVPSAPSKYLEEASRALREAGLQVDSLSGLFLDSPAGLVSLMLPRILWGSSPVAPGFHPVKPWGKGRSLYRIPALIGTTVSATLRLSHYRDHLYAEIEAAEELLGEAKAAGGVLAVSMGRMGPAEPGRAPAAHLYFPWRVGGLEESIRGAGAAVAAALLLSGVVERKHASIQLLRGYTMLLPGEMTTVRDLLESDTLLAASTLEALVERHVQKHVRDTILDVLRLIYRVYGWKGVEAVLASAYSLFEASKKHV